MATIKLYTRNILETGTVTVTGTPDTGYPKSRLYDRAISLYWKDTCTEAKTFQVDQGASDIKAVDALFIAKHNFDGASMTWEYSDDGSTWNAACSGWTQSGNTQIEKIIASPVTARYWRVTVSSLTNPQCSEIFMSYGYGYTVDFNSSPVLESQPNVQWNITVGGLERSTKFGNSRRVRQYGLFLESDAGTITTFRSAMDDLDHYSKPFYLKDHEGTYFMVRLTEVPQETFLTEGHVTMTANMIEML